MGLWWADGYTNVELGEHRAVFGEAVFILPIDISDGWGTKGNKADGNFMNTSALSFNVQNVVT